MHLTHFGHACVLVETATSRVLFDPGTLSSGFEAVRDLDLVLITHQHADHLDGARLRALVAANPHAVLVVDPGSAPVADELGLPARVVATGDRLTAAGVTVDVVGGTHAVVHADIPTVPNAGYVLDHGAFYHPGDSFVVPSHDIDVFGLPVSGPWLKVGEAVDFLRAVAPRIAVPIHEAALASTTTSYTMLARLAPAATTWRPVTHAVPEAF